MNEPTNESLVEDRIKNAQAQLRRADDLLQTAADFRAAMDAVGAVIDACRGLVGIVREQQGEISRLREAAKS